MPLLRVINHPGRDGKVLCLLCHVRMPGARPGQDFCKPAHRALWHAKVKRVLEEAGLKPRSNLNEGAVKGKACNPGQSGESPGSQSQGREQPGPDLRRSMRDPGPAALDTAEEPRNRAGGAPLDYDDPSPDGLTAEDYKYDDRKPGEL